MSAECQVTGDGVLVHMPASLCEALLEAFPTRAAETSADLAAIVRDLLTQNQSASSPPCPLATAKCRHNSTSSATPELHGGPEGAYQRDVSTGRWRSLSQDRPRRVPRMPITKSSGLTVNSLKADDASKPEEPVTEAENSELAAAEAALNTAKGETLKLWNAAKSVLADPVFQVLKKQGDMQRKLAEVEFEESMQAASWQLLRGSVDKKALGEITRLAAGCAARLES